MIKDEVGDREVKKMLIMLVVLMAVLGGIEFVLLKTYMWDNEQWWYDYHAGQDRDSVMTNQYMDFAFMVIVYNFVLVAGTYCGYLIAKEKITSWRERGLRH